MGGAGAPSDANIRSICFEGKEVDYLQEYLKEIANIISINYEELNHCSLDKKKNKIHV